MRLESSAGIKFQCGCWQFEYVKSKENGFKEFAFCFNFCKVHISRQKIPAHSRDAGIIVHNAIFICPYIFRCSQHSICAIAG